MEREKGIKERRKREKKRMNEIYFNIFYLLSDREPSVVQEYYQKL
jgi:hypothetical protein